MFSSSCRGPVDISEDNISQNLQDGDICYSGTQFHQRRFLSGQAKARIITWLDGSSGTLDKAKSKVIKAINDYDHGERTAVRAYIEALPADPHPVVKNFLKEMSK